MNKEMLEAMKKQKIHPQLQKRSYDTGRCTSGDIKDCYLCAYRWRKTVPQ